VTLFFNYLFVIKAQCLIRHKNNFAFLFLPCILRFNETGRIERDEYGIGYTGFYMCEFAAFIDLDDLRPYSGQRFR